MTEPRPALPLRLPLYLPLLLGLLMHAPQARSQDWDTETFTPQLRLGASLTYIWDNEATDFEEYTLT
ncbi:MAG: hypothetical protein OHK0039_12950 [Bacteroidia bacterium]